MLTESHSPDPWRTSVQKVQPPVLVCCDCGCSRRWVSAEESPTCREWRHFQVSLCSGSWDQRAARSSSGTTCCEGNTLDEWRRPRGCRSCQSPSLHVTSRFTLHCHYTVVSGSRGNTHWLTRTHTHRSWLDNERLMACSAVRWPFELVLLVPDVIGLVVREELSDAIGQVAVDAVHVAGRGHDGTDVFVAVVDALLHLQRDHDITSYCSPCHCPAW